MQSVKKEILQGWWGKKEVQVWVFWDFFTHWAKEEPCRLSRIFTAKNQRGRGSVGISACRNCPQAAQE